MIDKNRSLRITEKYDDGEWNIVYRLYCGLCVPGNECGAYDEHQKRIEHAGTK